MEQLSKEFDCTKLTISRNLKKNIGEQKYKEIINSNKSSNNYLPNEENVCLEKNNELNKKNNFDDFFFEK